VKTKYEMMLLSNSVVIPSRRQSLLIAIPIYSLRVSGLLRKAICRSLMDLEPLSCSQAQELAYWQALISQSSDLIHSIRINKAFIGNAAID